MKVGDVVIDMWGKIGLVIEMFKHGPSLECPIVSFVGMVLYEDGHIWYCEECDAEVISESR